MKNLVAITRGLGVALVLSVFALPDQVAVAQDAGAHDAMEEVVVTGSRIRRDPLNEATAVMEIGFAPEYGVARGVAETAAWYREAQWI